MKIRGIAKVRNEGHIIRKTLDNFAEYCTDGIHVYDDCSTDLTVQICREHPAVVEVVSSDLFDPDRERAEWFNRAAVLKSAQRFLSENDWICYFDADEALVGFDTGLLEDPHIRAIAVCSHDVYITPEDRDVTEWECQKRRWCGPEFEVQTYFYRNSPYLQYFQPDQRNPNIMEPLKKGELMVSGLAMHWGKGDSIRRFEQRCDYYSRVFGPKYAAKWEARKGNAVKEDMKSDFGNPLVLVEDVIAGRAETFNKRTQKLCR